MSHTKKFDEYQSNPDALDVDEGNVDELISQLGQDADADAETGDPTDEAREDGADKVEQTPETDEAKATDDTTATGQDDPKVEPAAKQDEPPQRVVLTRDGKHEIPYSVLERERQEKLQAQREREQARQELAELKRKQQELRDQAPTTTPDQPAGQSADKDDFDLEVFREEFGDEAAQAELKRRKKYEAMEARQQQLEQELADNRKWREAQEAKAKDSEASEITEAIDSIPELRGWRDNNDPMWDAAVALDNRLMSDPEFADKSYRQRFIAVVERLTGRSLSDDTTTTETTEAALDKKLQEQELAGGKPPSSLSDLPGGHMPDQSEQDTLERMSVSQLERKFESMTPEQQAEYLARL